MDERPVLVLGSTGYVGGRLVPLLLERGHKVRAAGRSVDKILSRPWGNNPNVEAVQADMHDVDSLKKAAKGCRAASILYTPWGIPIGICRTGTGRGLQHDPGCGSRRVEAYHLPGWFG